ncbi:MAG: L-histidine N(alpha)-methyltransferase [Luteitalea sp.]|nr:L-histidine N(alpha)-methyltransferase [Luteitalea sp.]
MPTSAVSPVSPASSTLADMMRDVRASLGRNHQKTLSSTYLWDDLGSALFEAITLLPEYGLTRAGERLVTAHSDELAALMTMPIAVAELGSGTAHNTRVLLSALCRHQPTSYYAIEVSRWALERCRAELAAIDGLTVHEVPRSYLDGLDAVVRRLPADHRLLLLFLGSTIGNFDRPAADAFLRELRALLRPGDALLLGTDLQQSEEALLPAYDDARGITAAFNLNILARVNRELDGDFDLRQFAHRVLYNPRHRRVELYLESQQQQRVRLRKAALDVELGAGETILTEYSHKFDASEVATMAERAGYRCVAQWQDTVWPFAHTLMHP